eukprot:COSAG06_NODE_4550_length_4156_cov_4.716293_4_plen_62_part_00
MMSVVLFLRRCAQRFLDATTDHVQGRAWGDDEETSERVVVMFCVFRRGNPISRSSGRLERS